MHFGLRLTQVRSEVFVCALVWYWVAGLQVVSLVHCLFDMNWLAFWVGERLSHSSEAHFVSLAHCRSVVLVGALITYKSRSFAHFESALHCLSKLLVGALSSYCDALHCALSAAHTLSLLAVGATASYSPVAQGARTAAHCLLRVLVGCVRSYAVNTAAFVFWYTHDPARSSKREE